MKVTISLFNLTNFHFNFSLKSVQRTHTHTSVINHLFPRRVTHVARLHPHRHHCHYFSRTITHACAVCAHNDIVFHDLFGQPGARSIPFRSLAPTDSEKPASLTRWHTSLSPPKYKARTAIDIHTHACGSREVRD